MFLIIFFDPQLFQSALCDINCLEPLQDSSYFLTDFAHVPDDHEAPFSKSGIVFIHPCIVQNEPDVLLILLYEHPLDMRFLLVCQVRYKFCAV